MKCTCGAYKTYGARSGSPLHSEWCDTRKFDYDALAVAMGEAMTAAKRKMVVVPHTRQAKAYVETYHIDSDYGLLLFIRALLGK